MEVHGDLHTRIGMNRIDQLDIGAIRDPGQGRQILSNASPKLTRRCAVSDSTC
jgi:hypothetical protein